MATIFQVEYSYNDKRYVALVVCADKEFEIPTRLAHAHYTKISNITVHQITPTSTDVFFI